MLKYFKNIVTVCLCLLCFAGSLCAQSGRPFISNYGMKDYKASAQIWDIVQDRRGVMYFANEKGILEYDGVNWRKISIKNQTVARSLHCASDGIIYAGGVGDFGYLRPDSLGNSGFVSLLDELKAEEKDFADVWQIQEVDGTVYFRTHTKIFAFKNFKFERVWSQSESSFTENSVFHRMTSLHGRLFVTHRHSGMKILDSEGNLRFISGGETFTDALVYGMEEYDNEQVIFFSRTRGTYLYHIEKDSLYRFKTEADLAIRRDRIYTTSKIELKGERLFVIGTQTAGLLLMNKSGQAVRRMDKKSGIRDKNIRAIHRDRQGALWLGLDNGISRVEISSPLSIFGENEGIVGSAESVIMHDDMLYASTGLGVFYRSESLFRPVRGISTQSWDFCRLAHTEGDTSLLSSTNDGVYLLRGDSARLITKEDHTYFNNFLLSRFDPDMVFAGGEAGILVLRYENGQWRDKGYITGILHDEVRSMAEDKTGKLWCGTDHKGVFSLRFDGDDFMHPAEITVYDTLKGLPSMNRSSVFWTDDQMLIGTPQGLFVHDPKTDQLIPSDYLGKTFTEGHIGISAITEDRNKTLWVFVTNGDEDWLDVARKNEEGVYETDTTSLRRMGRSSLTGVYTDNQNFTWVACSYGLYRYNEQHGNETEKKFPALIREVTLGDRLLFGGTYFSENKTGLKLSNFQPENMRFDLPSDENSLTFHFSGPSYDDEETNTFSYYLFPYEKKPSQWSTKTRKEYTNLPGGNYIFRVKSKNIHGLVSDEAVYHFTIRKPWYLKPWVVMLFVIFGITTFWSFLETKTRRLRRDKTRLGNLVLRRTGEIVRQKEQIEYKNKNLEQQKQELAERKNQIQQSYRNVKLLSTIGQDITATLNVEDIIETVYENVNNLMDAAAFGIGLCEDDHINFRGFIEKGVKLPPHREEMNPDRRLAAQCVIRKQEILINDYSVERTIYLNSSRKKAEYGEMPESIIYAPLISKEKIIGVVTVQSFKKNAYTNYHMNIMQNMAVYVAISIENALLYEKQEEKVRERTAEVVLQNQEIERKTALLQKRNNDITASINYARRIQNAILPTDDEMNHLFDDYFVMLKPRDIISGDFYWAAEIDGRIMAAAVDCTGHGVPGAFMSMIGTDLLNETVNLLEITSPDLILNHLHAGVRKSLRQYETHNRDGMDISLFSINPEEKIMEFAGAKNHLHYIQEEKLHVIKGSKMPIGGLQREEKRIFAKETVILDKPTVCYIFSDGYQDQIGGPDGRKLMIRLLREMLVEIHTKPMSEQQAILEEKLDNWKGNSRQIDDILVMGFRFNY